MITTGPFMTELTSSAKKIQEYREQAAALKDFYDIHFKELCCERKLQDLQAKAAELQSLTATFEELRQQLTPSEIFIATYGVTVLDDHTVSFVIPKGVSRLSILQTANTLTTDRPLINSQHLKQWGSISAFRTKLKESQLICIDGEVPHTAGKHREEQELMVGRSNLALVEDLAVAFAVNWIVTGRPLFGSRPDTIRVDTVRAANHRALKFTSNGLAQCRVEKFAWRSVAISKRVLCK